MLRIWWRFFTAESLNFCICHYTTLLPRPKQAEFSQELYLTVLVAFSMYGLFDEMDVLEKSLNFDQYNAEVTRNAKNYNLKEKLK